MILPFLAQAAASSLLGLVFTEALRSKESKERDAVSGVAASLSKAAIRRMAHISGTHTGHYTPPDVVELEEQLHSIAHELRGGGIGSIGRGQPGEMIMSDYDIVGADLMFGADDSDVLEALSVSGDGSSEIIGAELIGAVARSNPRAAQALRQVAMRNAGAVIKNQLKNKRRYPLGFVPTEVDAGDAATIPAAPQNLFRPERLVIPSDICFDFGVQDIKVGNQSQFAQSVEVPAAVFSEVSIDTNVTFDTAEIGNQISILVRNKGATDNLEFTAAALGTIAKA